jgi:nucleotide-binding universal stress UspA family protein
MSYKSIVVHLDTSERAHPRLEIALRLASQFGAHLTGLFATFTPEPRSFYVRAGAADYFIEHERTRVQHRAALERLFHAEIARAKVEGEWVATTEYANLSVPRRARYADLIVAGQLDPNDPDSYIADHFAENLVMSCGRTVRLVPYTGVWPSSGHHAVVAGDGSREATRAMHDALPLLAHAKKTTVLTVNGTRGEPVGYVCDDPDVALVIARHGVEVDVVEFESPSGVPVGETLLSRAADAGADLLGMGGYGHARWQELVMGGATRTLLRSMTMPVLMSH